MLPAFYKFSFQSNNPPQIIDFLPKQVKSSILYRSGRQEVVQSLRLACQPEEEKELWAHLQVCQGGTHPFIRATHLHIHSWQEPALSEPTIQSTSPPAPAVHPPLHHFHLSQSSHSLWLKPTLLPETTTRSRVPEIHPFMSARDGQNISTSPTRVDHPVTPLCWSAGGYITRTSASGLTVAASEFIPT